MQKTTGAADSEEEDVKTSEIKTKKDGGKALTTKGKEKSSEKVAMGEKQETETITSQQQQQGVSPKIFAPFFEVGMEHLCPLPLPS